MPRIRTVILVAPWVSDLYSIVSETRSRYWPAREAVILPPVQLTLDVYSYWRSCRRFGSFSELYALKLPRSIRCATFHHEHRAENIAEGDTVTELHK